MSKLLFPRDWVKLTQNKKEQLVTKLQDITRESDSIKTILLVDEKREFIVAYWNSLSTEDRKNIGQRDDGMRSAITFENVAHLEFKDLDEFWQGTFLASCADASIELLKECTEKKSLTV